MSDLSRSGSSFDVLRQFVRRKSPAETCEMCGRELPANHQHLLEPVSPQVSLRLRRLRDSLS